MPEVVTLTMNPAVDVATATPRVEPEHKLRCGPAATHPGGGGINVARVLARLGIDVRAVFPAGGLTGQLLCELLQGEDLRSECVAIAGATRESFSVTESTTGHQYRFVLPGPALSTAEWEACLARTLATAAGARFVVASGSLPPGVPTDLHARLADAVAARGQRLVLDTSGPALAEALRAGGVHLFKPSLRELRELTGLALADQRAQVDCCRALIAGGQARVVALSLGAQGALLVGRDEAWHAPALPVQVASTIGAGDSFVAGLLAALVRDAGLHDALRHAMAASAAALLAPGTALCRPDDVQRLLPQVQVTPA